MLLLYATEIVDIPPVYVSFATNAKADVGGEDIEEKCMLGDGTSKLRALIASCNYGWDGV